jgi:transposase
MLRTFKTADYEATLELKVPLREALPPDHLARLVVDRVAQLDFSRFYARFSACGGQPYAPEILFALLV